MKERIRLIQHLYRIYYNTIIEKVRDLRNLRIFIAVKCKLFMENKDNKIFVSPFAHNIGKCDISNINEFKDYIKKFVLSLMEKIDCMNYFHSINFETSDIFVYKFRPLVGSSYKKLPKEIENTKACINVKNTDNKCFMWSLLA